MTPLPVGSTNSNFAQIDAERVMGVGGWTSDNNKKVIVYSSVYKSVTDSYSCHETEFIENT